MKRVMQQLIAWLIAWRDAFDEAGHVSQLDVGHGLDCACEQCQRRRGGIPDRGFRNPHQ